MRMKKKTHLLHFYQPVQYGHSVYTFVSDSSILNANIGVKQFFFFKTDAGYKQHASRLFNRQR